MISPLFSKIPHEFIEEFKLDFLPLVRMTKELDKEFGEAEEEIVYNLPKYKMYVALFNKKYRWVYVKFIETNEGFQLRLYIKGEKNVKDAFLNAASKIEGVLAIGAESLERDSVFDQNELELELMQIRDRIHILYSGNASILLRLDKMEKLVELCYDQKTILNERGPEFKLFAYYALRDGYDRKINLRDVAGAFSTAASGVGKTFVGPVR
ncbi:MAG TPA: hypothetical protein VI894_02875 [Candidatus Nanoarchaeia archaeon]|nr:hypothetical protein [Candidatus Nanoarchaeia archaeon]